MTLAIAPRYASKEQAILIAVAPRGKSSPDVTENFIQQTRSGWRWAYFLPEAHAQVASSIDFGPNSHEIFSVYPFDAPESLKAIRNSIRCNKHLDRHTMRIHVQMYPGIEPPFVRGMS